GLYPVASIAAAALAYGAAATLHGSGFLSVYLCGLALGSAPTPATRTITTFHDGLAWIAQLTLFLTLGLLVFPGQLGAVALEGTVLAFVVAVVARPVAAIIATALHRFTLRERLVLGWAGLRGAAQRDRPRRAGDPPARLDDDRGRRSPARPRAPGGRRRVPPLARRLADRAARRRAPPRGDARQHGLHHASVALRGRRPRPAADRGPRPRRRAAAHPPRRARRGRRAGRRALRVHGAGRGDRLGPAGPGRRTTAAADRP